MDAGSILREARRRSGLTLRQLAQRAGTSHSAIAAYESGSRAPNWATLLRLVAACGFALDAEVRPLGPVEDRARRGRELVEVLELADAFPSVHPEAIGRRFPAS